MDKTEFKSRVLPVRDTLFRLALSLLKNREEAEDVLQDVLLKLWDRRNRLVRLGNIEAFAVTVTRNHCLDRLKSYRHKNRSGTAIDKLPLASTQLLPDRQAELGDTMRHMRKAFDQLPENQRLVLHLRDVEHYSYDEIAAVTGQSAGALRVTLSRARKQVREALQNIHSHGTSKDQKTAE